MAKCRKGGALVRSSQPVMVALARKSFAICRMRAGRRDALRPGTSPALTPHVSSPQFARKPLVLVAEDESEAAELIESILRREGCEVLIATDGAEALEMARELPRSDHSLSGIPVFVVSGAADATTVRATDNVRKARLLDGLGRVMARLRGEMTSAPESERLALVEAAAG
jgi:PleD family two-component response regulator